MLALLRAISLPKLLPLALTAAVFVAACSSSTNHVNREAAAEVAVEPDSAVAEQAPDKGPMVGGPMDLTRLPFAVVNNLPVSVHVRVNDVDPYDWSTGSGIGTPLDLQPKGLNGAILAPNTSATATFEPKSNASGAPFRLTLSSQVGTFPFTKSEPLADVAFNKVYYCERLPIAQQVACATPARQHWKGWSYRGGDKLAISDQFPQVCGRTSEIFTYHLDDVEHRAQGRLDCASKATAGLGTALVLEDVS
jgi:hypothetical protein